MCARQAITRWRWRLRAAALHPKLRNITCTHTAHTHSIRGFVPPSSAAASCVQAADIAIKGRRVGVQTHAPGTQLAKTLRQIKRVKTIGYLQRVCVTRRAHRQKERERERVCTGGIKRAHRLIAGRLNSLRGGKTRHLHSNETR